MQSNARNTITRPLDALRRFLSGGLPMGRSLSGGALRVYELVLLTVGLGIFWTLAGYQIELPGPHYDEAIEVLPAMQMLLGQPVEAFRGAGLQIGSFFFPVMVMDYIGAMNTYLVWPFFLIFGINTVAMRLMPLTFAGLTLIFTYLTARELSGRAGAAIALITLAPMASFVFWSRQGIFVTNLTATLMMLALFSALRWWHSRRRPYLALAAICCGVGLYTKFIFLWALIGMLGAATLLNVDRLLSLWRRRRQPRAATGVRTLAGEDVLVALAAFLLGLLPLIAYNIQTGGTLGTLSSNFFTSYYGVNNLNILANLATRLEQFRTVLRGDHFWYLGETFANTLWLPALLASLALLVLGAVLGRRAWRRAAFPFVMLVLILLQSCFTISALWFTHFAILMPLPPLALACGVTLAARDGRHNRALWPALVILFAALFAQDVIADVRYHTVLAATGGYSAHSDASYRLAERLRDRTIDGRPVVALDWGIQAQVQFLTLGEVAPRELFGYDRLDEPDAEFASRLVPYLDDPRTQYVFHSNDEEVYRGRSLAFAEAVALAGKSSHIVEVIYERSGRPVYVVVEVN